MENPVLSTPDDYTTRFDPDAYLHHFYSEKANVDGTRLSLFALPMFAHLIEHQMAPTERRSLLDVGAGPTIYSAVCFRNVVERICLSDYVAKNLDALDRWLTRDDAAFDWRAVIRAINRSEGKHPISDDEVQAIEDVTRERVRMGGIVHADVHRDKVLDGSDNQTQLFDIVVSIFCLESACTSYDDYCRAVLRIVALIRPGGRLILGSVLNDNEYSFRASDSRYLHRFKLLYVSESDIMRALDAAGIDTANARKYVLEEDGAIMIFGTKMIVKE